MLITDRRNPNICNVDSGCKPAKLPKVLGLVEGGDAALEKTGHTVTERGGQRPAGDTARNVWESGVRQLVEDTVKNVLESGAQQQAEWTVQGLLKTRVQQLVESNVAAVEGRLRTLLTSSAAELECRLQTLVDGRVKKLEEESSAQVESRLRTRAGRGIEGRVQRLEARIGAEVERRLQTLEGRGVPQLLQEADTAALGCRLQTQLETRVIRLVASGTDELERRLQALVETRFKQLEETTAAAVDSRLQTLAESRAQQPTESSAAQLGWTEQGITENTAPQRVALEWSDIRCLEQGQWLSDTIVDFYAEYIQHRSRERKGPPTFCIFNTFVYRKFLDSIHHEDGEVGKPSPPFFQQRKPAETCCGIIAKGYIDTVRRWMAKAYIIEKTYLLVPIIKESHWSLAIICHPRGSNKESGGMRCILHLDSKPGYHHSKLIFRQVRRFLKAAWSGEKDAADKFQDQDFNECIVPVPKQTNGDDCGPFVLYSMDKFVSEAPPVFTKQEMSRYSDPAVSCDVSLAWIRVTL